MDGYRRKRESRARERQIARQRRREVITQLPEMLPSQLRRGDRGTAVRRAWRTVRVMAADLWWHVTHRAVIIQIATGIFGILVGAFILSHLFGQQIFPNVWALGVDLGDMTIEQAADVLDQAWAEQVRIRLYADNVEITTASPLDLGLRIDSLALAEAARRVGLAGIPLGYEIVPDVTMDYITAQNYLLDLSSQVDSQPNNAGFAWQGAQLVEVPGRNGRALDVAQTLALIQQNPANLLRRSRLDLIITPLEPDTEDASPYLEEMRTLALNPPVLVGYDPYTDTTSTWTTSPDQYLSWFEAGPGGLTLRQNAIIPFVRALSDTLEPARTMFTEEQRYIDPVEAYEAMSEAILNGESTVYLRVRYARGTYTIESNDTGFRISRRTGLPFLQISYENPSVDWGMLSIGDALTLPSRDVTMPETPVPNKRIIVDLDSYMLYAYENRQLVFSWQIATGVRNAPTSPGIYQILNHDPVAYGSSNTLCDDAGLVCGQWEMYWFMSIYEVSPGLLNGFHGAVLLPNGTYLSGGAVGAPGTFGCVMSENTNAELLYNWAEVGTVVEIVSGEFAPMSDLARLATGRQS